MIAAIEAALQHDVAGDPITGIRWTRRTTEKIAGLGRVLFRLGHYAEALDAMARATALQPDLPRAGAMYRLMGQAAQELGQSEAAAEHYERALQLDLRDAPALDRLAMVRLVRFGQRNYGAALDLYRRLLEIDPATAQTHANLAATLYYLGRVDEAIASLERALSLGLVPADS